jgi:hypothetical protein
MYSPIRKRDACTFSLRCIFIGFAAGKENFSSKCSMKPGSKALPALILALGFCATCSTLKRQDEEYLAVCESRSSSETAIAAVFVVHHRVPGRSVLHLLISLCPGCHAKVGRTKAVLSQMPALLLELWREQHPFGHEQTTLDFKAKYPAANTAPLFLDRSTGHRQTYTL